MTGLIWLIQLVHYPLFAEVGPANYKVYQQQHMRRITWIVLPVMLVELATGALLTYNAYTGELNLSLTTGVLSVVPEGESFFLLNFVGIVLIWLSTVLLQVPAHKDLLAGFDLAAQRRLVYTNWIRTILWTIRSGALFCVLDALVCRI